jgi:hypothetical protein
MQTKVNGVGHEKTMTTTIRRRRREKKEQQLNKQEREREREKRKAIITDVAQGPIEWQSDRLCLDINIHCI